MLNSCCVTSSDNANVDLHDPVGVVEAGRAPLEAPLLPELLPQLVYGPAVREQPGEVLEVEGAGDVAPEVRPHAAAERRADHALRDADAVPLHVFGELFRPRAHRELPVVLAGHVWVGAPVAPRLGGRRERLPDLHPLPRGAAQLDPTPGNYI